MAARRKGAIMEITNRNQYFETIIGDCSIEYKKSRRPTLSTYHFHSLYEVTLVLTDSVTVTVEDDKYDVPPNTLLLFSNTDLHKVESKNQNDFERYVLVFDPDYLDTISDHQTDVLAMYFYRPAPGMQILPLRDEDVSVVRRLMDDVLAMEFADSCYGQKLMIKLLVGELLVYINNVYWKTHNLDISSLQFEDRSIFSTMRYINGNLDSDLSVGTLAKNVYTNTQKFTHNFRRIAGTTPNKYVIKCRIQKAKILLRKGYRVEQVCDLTGFRNLSNFSRTFKNNVGMSPKQYALNNKDTIVTLK